MNSRIFLYLGFAWLCFSNPLQAESNENESQPTKKYSAFQKTDTSLIYEIETKLKKDTYTTKRGSTKKLKLPPKQRRFEIAKKGLNKLIWKDAIPHSLIGGLVGAVATVHPAGVVVGGIAGTLQGKSNRYEEAQGKLHKMEKEIFASKDYEVTPEEERLAKFSGADLSEFYALAPIIDTPKKKTPVAPLAPPSPPPVLAHCYGQSTNDTPLTGATSRRQLASQCFYNMN